MVLLILIWAVGGCDRGGNFLEPVRELCRARCGCSGDADPTATARFEQYLGANAATYERAVAAATAWFDQTKVDPAELRSKGIKGKKKLAELLNSYVSLSRRADSPQEKAHMQRRMADVVAVTRTAAYHDMGGIPDLQFKQDATSYLRVAYLMDTVGLDTTLYRREIAKVKARLDGHMGIRGANQQMAFHNYYTHFGLKEPFPLASGFDRSEIAARTDPYKLDSNGVYRFTHEVFVPYDFGLRPDADFFSDDDLVYIRRALDILLPAYVYKGDPDLVAELVSCAWYVGYVETPRLQEALEYLLGSQNADGSWGRYKSMEKRYGAYVRQGWYLHTTMVVVEALMTVFEKAPERPASAAVIEFAGLGHSFNDKGR